MDSVLLEQYEAAFRRREEATVRYYAAGDALSAAEISLREIEEKLDDSHEMAKAEARLRVKGRA